MSAPTSRLSYSDCFEYLQLASEDPKGVRLRLPTYEAANFLRMRIHQARKLDREANSETYPTDHQMHGQSTYDQLQVRITTEPDSAVYLYITSRRADIIGEIEFFSTKEPVECPDPQPLSPSTSITGMTPLMNKSAYASTPTNDSTSSTSSTLPDKTPPIPSLRRL